MEQTVYIKVTSDKYRLIVAMADTAGELARITGLKKESIYSMISKNYGTVERVVITDDE